MSIDKDEIVRLTEAYGGQWGIRHARRLLKLIEVIGEGQSYNSAGQGFPVCCAWRNRRSWPSSACGRWTNCLPGLSRIPGESFRSCLSEHCVLGGKNLPPRAQRRDRVYPEVSVRGYTFSERSNSLAYIRQAWIWLRVSPG